MVSLDPVGDHNAIDQGLDSPISNDRAMNDRAIDVERAPRVNRCP